MTRIHWYIGSTFLLIFLIMWASLQLRPVQLANRASTDFYFDSTDESALQVSALPQISKVIPTLAKKLVAMVNDKLKSKTETNGAIPALPAGQLGAIRALSAGQPAGSKTKKQVVRYISASERRVKAIGDHSKTISKQVSNFNSIKKSSALSATQPPSGVPTFVSTGTKASANPGSNQSKDKTEEAKKLTARDWYERLSDTPDKKTVFEFSQKTNLGDVAKEDFLMVVADLIRNMNRSQAVTALTLLQSTSTTEGFSLLVELEMRYSSDEALTRSIAATYKSMSRSLAYTALISRALNQTANAYVQISALNVLSGAAQYFSVSPKNENQSPTSGSSGAQVTSSTAHFQTFQADAIFKQVRDSADKTSQLSKDVNVIEKADNLVMFIDSVLGTSQSLASTAP